MLSSNKNKLDESMMFHRGVAGGPPDLKIYLVNHQFTVFFLPTIAPHPPDVPLSVWYEAKGSKHVKGKVVMLSSIKNKVHELKKGRQGQGGHHPFLILEIYLMFHFTS